MYHQLRVLKDQISTHVRTHRDPDPKRSSMSGSDDGGNSTHWMGTSTTQLCDWCFSQLRRSFRATRSFGRHRAASAPLPRHEASADEGSFGRPHRAKGRDEEREVEPGDFATSCANAATRWWADAAGAGMPGMPGYMVIEDTIEFQDIFR